MRTEHISIRNHDLEDFSVCGPKLDTRRYSKSGVSTIFLPSVVPGDSLSDRSFKVGGGKTNLQHHLRRYICLCEVLTLLQAINFLWTSRIFRKRLKKDVQNKWPHKVSQFFGWVLCGYAGTVISIQLSGMYTYFQSLGFVSHCSSSSAQ